jgi:hypothetical protein
MKNSVKTIFHHRLFFSENGVPDDLVWPNYQVFVFGLAGRIKCQRMDVLRPNGVARLTHKVHILEANGVSYRRKQSRERFARQKKRAGRD